MVNKGIYVKPWTRQKKLQSTYSLTEMPSINELVNLINTIEVGKDFNPFGGENKKAFQTARAKALFAMYYLTAARATELLPYKEKRRRAVRKEEAFDNKGMKFWKYQLDENEERITKFWTEKHNYEGAKKRDISFQEIDGKQCMLIRIENRKNKHKLTKRLPIPIEKEAPIAKLLTDYLRLIKDDDILFKFSRQRASQIINLTGFNLHFIRHIRATHLITLYDFNEQALIRFMGWTDSRPAKHYMELRSSDIFRQFYRR